VISMSVHVKVIPQKEKEFLQTMESLKREGKSLRGLRSIHIFQDVEDQTCFSLIKEWESDEDLKNYLKGENFTILLGAMEVLCESSEIRCSEFSQK